jgi:hypothetical protein
MLYRLSKMDSQHALTICVAKVEDIERALPVSEPGQYVIDELNLECKPVAGARCSRRWGIATKQPDGTVRIDRSRRPAWRSFFHAIVGSIADR